MEALRTRMVLAAAEGKPRVEIMGKEQITHNTVRLWRNRWVNLLERKHPVKFRCKTRKLENLWRLLTVYL